jgi:predicted nuclease of predicted toxin-antitoxin system
VKFKTDENLPREAATVLQSAGFDAETVWSEALSGAPDEILADRARREARGRWIRQELRLIKSLEIQALFPH